MDIGGIASQNSGLYSPRTGLDGVQKAAGDPQGSGQSQQPELASGRNVDRTLQESTVNPNAPAASTQVVSESSESSETTQEPGERLGLRVDTRA